MLLTVPRPAKRVGELPELLRGQLLGSAPVKGRGGQESVEFVDRWGESPPRELRLVHQRAEVEPRVQESEGDGGRDLVRQVAHDLVESWKRDSQGVPTNHLQVAAEVVQSRGKPTVPFHRHDSGGALQEESGENPEPGSDLQDHIVGADAGELDVAVGDAGIDEEVLPQPLRRSHPAHAEALPDFLDVHESTSFRRTIILGHTLIYGGRNRRPWTSPRLRPRCSARKVSRAGRSASSSASPSSRSSA